METTASPPTPAGRDFPLGIEGFTYQDLHRDERLADLDRAFLEELHREDPALAGRLAAYRATPASLDPLARSRLLVDAARPVARFVARLFRVEAEWRKQASGAEPEAVLFRFRRDFLLRRAVKTKLPEDLAASLPTLVEGGKAIEGLFPDLPWSEDPELATARMAVSLLDLESEFLAAIRQKKVPEVSETARARARKLAALASSTWPGALPRPGGADEELLAFLEGLVNAYALWCHARLRHPEARRAIAGWVCFRLPEPLDYQRLVETERPDSSFPEERVGPSRRRRRRQGFELTDRRMSRREVLGETHYCLLCHERQKDSCSTGFFDAKTNLYQKNPLGIPLSGCPLDEKISEMHQLRREGDSIGALALVCIDNPMCPGTGHRICNDCMKGCIFQKQDPVNIPQAETGVLTDVLALPWGVEIYGLLTRWNPLSPQRPYALPYNGKKVLVVGLGPAGYTLAHYLINEGFGVVGIDALRIEPLSVRMRGAKRRVPQPIKDINDITGPLDRRTILGFGGVSEYGIT
ncbi:MAG TPA: pyridine nucleotide-disulfide oxidoreductase, partial [Thermoanaerobaculia bacterium]|nr:pyridine nucleotide-disulfide oxidoreductase [Thermoanaerobaculia bacterium]